MFNIFFQQFCQDEIYPLSIILQNNNMCPVLDINNKLEDVQRFRPTGTLTI